MYSAKPILLLLLLTLCGCGDNLVPSGEDRRPAVEAGSTGAGVSQLAPDFAVQDTNGATVTKGTALAARKGAVFYFTMWCPICDEQTAQMQGMLPSYPGVGFYLVDYVSGSIADAGASALSNGFTGVGFATLADTNHILMNGLQATMGTTVVIDATGTIRMNEDFRDGTRLQAVLAGLP